ncbi:MAG: AmpG family muropeptide MFS transporter [Gammaproteobacteria bacterium]|nr:AmpG family muropeptide MFS transporter [Gammaproteobacteria bacterium]
MAATELKKAIFNRRMLICVGTGFSSGLPLYIIYTLLPAWLRSEGVSLKEIGLFALIGIPYSWKFFWAPALDRYSMPFLGHRRGWMLLFQCCLLISIAGLGFFSPTFSIGLIAYLAFAVAFFSASQDVVLDAYRRELLSDYELGLGNSIHVNAYRVSGLIPGSLALILADHMAWREVFMVVAAFMLVGIAMTFLISEARTAPPRIMTMKEAVTTPFLEFFQRNGLKPALTILAFMFLYKLGDSMATALSTPFYQDLGFSLSEIGIIAKNAALWPAIFGGLAGGVLMLKWGINRSLWLFGLVQIISILGFALLSVTGPNKVVLALVIAFEYLGVGLGTAAFVAFIARTTHKDHIATQFALFTALTALPRTFANATTGFLIEGFGNDSVLVHLFGSHPFLVSGLGYTNFFVFCTLAAIPGMLLLFYVAPWSDQSAEDSKP